MHAPDPTDCRVVELSYGAAQQAIELVDSALSKEAHVRERLRAAGEDAEVELKVVSARLRALRRELAEQLLSAPEAPVEVEGGTKEG